MTVRVKREVVVPGSVDRVWSFLADPETRARAISVVDDWERRADGGVIWHVRLPIPVVNQSIEVRTDERERRSGEFVQFVGRSRVFRVSGEHELQGIDDETRVTSRFVVADPLPGLQSKFKRQLDRELDNLEAALRQFLEVSA